MAKDYFQDIVPPEEEPAEADDEKTADELHRIRINSAHAGRSIRNISAPRHRSSSDMRGSHAQLGSMRPKKKGSRWWMWLLAIVWTLALAVVLLMALRTTTVTITPRTHQLTFGPETTFTAYPESAASLGTLSYSVQTTEIEDSEVVESTGTVHAEEKASGNITIYNNYQTQPVKLIKNTRFASSNGLIFRIPADVAVPGKSGTTPGKVTVTVVADKAGAEYNVAAGKFTIPGLQSTPAMYAQVYAQSTEAMAGGFSGDRPGIAPGALEAANSVVRARLEARARTQNDETKVSGFTLPDLVVIRYEDMPQTPEGEGKIRIHEKAVISTPIFDESAFARAVGRSAIGDSDTASVSMIPGKNFGAHMTATSTVLGTDPLSFTLSGTARIVWNVDSGALAQALAGREQGAFESIVKTFEGVQEARARIQPFWKTAFPTDPSKIKIKVQAPQKGE